MGQSCLVSDLANCHNSKITLNERVVNVWESSGIRGCRRLIALNGLNGLNAQGGLNGLSALSGLNAQGAQKKLPDMCQATFPIELIECDRGLVVNSNGDLDCEGVDRLVSERFAEFLPAVGGLDSEAGVAKACTE